MSKEKILIPTDSIGAPTGFSNSAYGIIHSLAKKFDVHVLGLQTFQDHKAEINIHGEKRTVIEHANRPRSEARFDFGNRALPRLLDELEPDVLLTINDIQMIQHVPNTMCKDSIKLQVIDLPSKKFLSEEALKMQMLGELQKFKEKYPRQNKLIMYSPQDGDPPMIHWENVYRMADQVIGMSYYGQWVFKQWYNMEVPKIWHGVDTDIFKKIENARSPQLKDKFIVGNFNRNQPRKQPVRTIEAFAKFAKDKPDALLHMQMDWNDEFGWPIQYVAETYGVINKMITPERVGMPKEHLNKILNMWDLNLNCTGGEGFGIPIIEGYSAELPTLASEYTTSKELVIDGEPNPRGTLVKVKDLFWDKMDVAAVRRSLVDTDDFCNVMNKYYYNRDIIKEQGKNARAWTEKNVAWKVIEPQWINVIERVLSGEVITEKEIRL